MKPRVPVGGERSTTEEARRRWCGPAAALAGALSGGCTATISMTDGRVIEGHIHRSDARTLVVSPASCAEGSPAATEACEKESLLVHRNDVEAIDHPGAPQIGIGVGLLGAGPILFSLGFPHDGPSDFVQPLPIAGLASSVVGTVVFSLGMWTWARSDAAAQLRWE